MQLAARPDVGAVISGAVLRRVRAGHGESREAFAARAGVPAAAVAGAEDGTCPAWILPYDQYQAIEAAVAGAGRGVLRGRGLRSVPGGPAEGGRRDRGRRAGGAARGAREHGLGAADLGRDRFLDGKPAEYLTVPSSAPLLPVEVLSELAGLYVTVLIDGCGCSGSEL